MRLRQQFLAARQVMSSHPWAPRLLGSRRAIPVGVYGYYDAIMGTLIGLTAMVAAEVHDVTDPTLGWCESQVEFEFTLDLLLNGLERLRRAETDTPVADGIDQPS